MAWALDNYLRFLAIHDFAKRGHEFPPEIVAWYWTVGAELTAKGWVPW